MPEVPITWAGAFSFACVALTIIGMWYRNIAKPKQDRDAKINKLISDNRNNIDRLTDDIRRIEKAQEIRDQKNSEAIKRIFDLIEKHEDFCTKNRGETQKMFTEIKVQMTQLETIIKNIAPCMKK